MDWQGDEFYNDLEKQLARNLEASAIYLKGKVKEALNRSQGRKKSQGKKGIHYKGLDPSKPGEEPKKVVGFLQRSIAHEVSDDGKEAYVGSNLPQSLYLELGTSKMAARPFLRSTLLKEQDAIGKIVATGSR